MNVYILVNEAMNTMAGEDWPEPFDNLDEALAERDRLRDEYDNPDIHLYVATKMKENGDVISER